MKLVPYKRIGEVEEIGRAAVWLASDFTDYLVGTTLFIDGGMTLYPGSKPGLSCTRRRDPNCVLRLRRGRH